MNKLATSLLYKALLAVLVMLLPILVSFILGYENNKEFLKKSVLEDLTIIAESFEGQVYQFLEMSRRRVQDFSSDGVIRKGLQDIGSGDPKAAQALNEYLEKNKLAVDKTIRSISVMSAQGMVLASTDNDAVGKDMSSEPFFLNGINGLAVAESSHPEGLPEIVVSAPLRRADGSAAGVIANSIRLSELDRLLSGEFKKDLGAASWRNERKTMEVYLVNRQMRMLTKSRFAEDSLNRSVKTFPVLECLRSGKETSGFYEDYRGERVAGASMCLPEIKWTLLAEVDSSEVLASAARMKRDAFIAGTVAAALAAGLFAFFFGSVVRRLRMLSGASASMARGEYDITLPVSSHDEIGGLTESFNGMAIEIRKRAELLRENEERLKAVIENSTAIISLKDSAGRYILANRRFEEIFFVKRETIRGKTDSELFAEDIACALMLNDMKVLEAGAPLEFEEVVPQGDGAHYYLSVKVPVMGADSTPFAVCSISTDITERKRAEEKIARLNRIYSVLSKINEAIVRIRDTERLFEQACRIAVEDGQFLMAWVGIVSADAEMVSVAASFGAAKPYLDGASISVKDEPEGRGPTGTAIREGRYVICNDIEAEPRMVPWRKKALESGFRSSASFPLRIGGRAIGALNLYSGEVSFFTDDEIKLLEALLADISFAVESIELEKTAKRTDDELYLLQEITLAISEAKNFHSALSMAITKICEATGWSFGEVWIPSGDGQTLEYGSAYLASNVTGVETFNEISKGMKMPVGIGLPGRVWEAKKALWIRDVSGKDSKFLRSGFAMQTGIKAGFGVPVAANDSVLAVLVFFMAEAREEDRRLMDLVTAVTVQLGAALQRKQSEEARAEIQKRYEELVNNLTLGVYRTGGGENGRFLELNPAVVAMLDAESKEEVLRCRVSDFYLDKKKREEMTGKLMRQGWIKNEEVEFITLKGRRIWGSLSAVMKRDEKNGLYFDGIIEDITEHKKLSEQLVQSQKMEAVGQLAGGIAHDFNNILTAIIGYGNLLNMKRSEDELVKNYSGHILTLSEKAANLTQGLLAFSRKQLINPQPMDLNELVRRVEKILLRVIGEDIELKSELSGQPITIKADPTQIEQVLMNLSTNARDAMPDGGSLTISTATQELDREFVKAQGYGAPGMYAVITVSDSGSGMDEATVKRIFEPFFTTKEVGKGTGLGLSMVYGIIKQHNGFINVSSKPGKGAAFKVYLPLAGSAAEKIMIGGQAELRGGTETVLLAEDEGEVRNISKTLLEEFGYKVIAAVNGRDAVEKFIENKDEIDLVILDLIMPKMNGKDAYEAIKKVKPGIRALFTSGYAADIMKSKGIEGRVNFIAKPAPPVNFLKKIREVIEG